MFNFLSIFFLCGDFFLCWYIAVEIAENSAVETQHCLNCNSLLILHSAHGDGF